MGHVIGRGRRRVRQADPKLRQTLFDLSTHNGNPPMSRNRSWQGHPATLAATLLLHAAKEKGGVGTTSRVGKARAHRRGRIVLANPPSHRRNSPNANETRQRAFPIGVPGTRLRQVRPTVLGTLPLSRLCLSVIAAIAMARKPRAVLRAGPLSACSASRPVGLRHSHRGTRSKTQANSRTVRCIGSTCRLTGRWWGRPRIPMERLSRHLCARA
jgi:hypothetical protein